MDSAQQLRQISGAAEPRRGPQAAHGTRARWSHGCDCVQCRQAQNDTGKAYGRARAQDRLPIEVRQQLLDAIYAGQLFRTILRDLGLTPNKVWGLTKTDDQWAAALETALTASIDVSEAIRHAGMGPPVSSVDFDQHLWTPEFSPLCNWPGVLGSAVGPGILAEAQPRRVLRDGLWPHNANPKEIVTRCRP
jgi:hypothetical protein